MSNRYLYIKIKRFNLIQEKKLLAGREKRRFQLTFAKQYKAYITTKHFINDKPFFSLAIKQNRDLRVKIKNIITTSEVNRGGEAYHISSTY